jgi:hypothetical protein
MNATMVSKLSLVMARYGLIMIRMTGSAADKLVVQCSRPTVSGCIMLEWVSSLDGWQLHAPILGRLCLEDLAKNSNSSGL